MSLRFWKKKKRKERRKSEIIKSKFQTHKDVLTSSFPSLLLHLSFPHLYCSFLSYLLLYCLLPVSIFPRRTSCCELTTNLEPLMEFFSTTLSQPDRFICAHIKNMNTVLVRVGAAGFEPSTSVTVLLQTAVFVCLCFFISIASFPSYFLSSLIPSYPFLLPNTVPSFISTFPLLSYLSFFSFSTLSPPLLFFFLARPSSSSSFLFPTSYAPFTYSHPCLPPFQDLSLATISLVSSGAGGLRSFVRSPRATGLSSTGSLPSKTTRHQTRTRQDWRKPV